MFGLMKKDLLLIKNNKNVLLIATFMVIFLGIFGEIDISYILPFMVFTIYLSSFSYDEYNNFNSFVCSLPNGRENVVKAKYTLTILFAIVISVISFLITLITSQFGVEDVLYSVIGSTFALIIVVSIFYPLLFKYGAEKGRIMLLVSFLAIGGIIAFLMNNVKFNSASNVIEFINKFGLPIMIIISIISITISYFISKKVYLNKEF